MKFSVKIRIIQKFWFVVFTLQLEWFVNLNLLQIWTWTQTFFIFNFEHKIGIILCWDRISKGSLIWVYLIGPQGESRYNWLAFWLGWHIKPSMKFFFPVKSATRENSRAKYHNLGFGNQKVVRSSPCACTLLVLKISFWQSFMAAITKVYVSKAYVWNFIVDIKFYCWLAFYYKSRSDLDFSRRVLFSWGCK